VILGMEDAAINRSRAHGRALSHVTRQYEGRGKRCCQADGATTTEERLSVSWVLAEAISE
jgi:hypothetical protein